MKEEGESRLARSRENLEAARLLLMEGFPAVAVSRAYYAAFYAAEAALLVLGETRSKHSGVIAALGDLLAGEEALGEPTVRLLRSLFEKRMDADYASVPVTGEQAGAAVRDAERFVDAVAAWIEQRTE